MRDVPARLDGVGDVRVFGARDYAMRIWLDPEKVAALARTDEVVRRATKIILETPGVVHAVPFAGFDGATFSNAPNAGAIFSALGPFEERAEHELSAGRILDDLNARLGAIQEAFIITITPPPVRGIGTGGGSARSGKAR